MSKIIEAYRLVGEYPGLTRTIQVFDDKIIEIEFNFQDTDEIGIRFWNHYTDAAAENVHLQAYFADSEERFNREDTNAGIVNNSWIMLLNDTLHNNVKLPHKGYIYKGTTEELKANLKYAEMHRSPR